jgi:hypothetical protein
MDVWHVAHEAVHEFLHLDGKIFQTLRLLVLKPGLLTVEFLRGRRARYVGPLRLYLTCSLLFFLLASFAPGTVVTFTETDKKELGQETLNKAAETTQQLRERFVHDMPRGMFVLMPLFGLLTWAFYRKAQPYYVPHFYYSLHIHSFGFLAMSAKTTLSFLGRFGEAVGSVLPLVVVAYHYMALRRVFGGTRRQTAWKGTLIGVLYLVAWIGTFLTLVLLLLHASRGTSHVT